MPSKEKSLKLHVRKRMWERYGIKCTDAVYISLLRQIQKGTSKFVERQSNRVTIHDVVYSEKQIRVAYDSVRSALITALPPHTLELGNDWRLIK